MGRGGLSLVRLAHALDLLDQALERVMHGGKGVGQAVVGDREDAGVDRLPRPA